MFWAQTHTHSIRWLIELTAGWWLHIVVGALSEDVKTCTMKKYNQMETLHNKREITVWLKRHTNSIAYVCTNQILCGGVPCCSNLIFACVCVASHSFPAFYKIYKLLYGRSNNESFAASCIQFINNTAKEREHLRSPC